MYHEIDVTQILACTIVFYCINSNVVLSICNLAMTKPFRYSPLDLFTHLTTAAASLRNEWFDL